MFRSISKLLILTLFLLPSVRLSAQGPVALKHKYTKGATQNYKVSEKMKQTQSLAGMLLESSMNQEAYYSRTVDSVDSAGKAELKIKYSRIKVDGVFGPGANFKFDSDAKDNDKTGQIGAMVAPVMEKMSKAEYTVSIDANGKVVEVKGFIEQLADILKANPAAAQFAGADSNAAARNKEQQSTFVVSDKPVKVGDTWEVPMDADFGKLGKATGKMVCKYEGPDMIGNRKTAKVSFTTTIAMELNTEQGPAKVKGKLESTKGTGVAQFDVERGVLVSLNRSVTLAGKLEVDVGGMKIPVETKQDQSSTIELVEK